MGGVVKIVKNMAFRDSVRDQLSSLAISIQLHIEELYTESKEMIAEKDMFGNGDVIREPYKEMYIDRQTKKICLNEATRRYYGILVEKLNVLLNGFEERVHPDFDTDDEDIHCTVCWKKSSGQCPSHDDTPEPYNRKVDSWDM